MRFLAAILAAAAALAGAATPAAAPTARPLVRHLVVAGVISPVTADFMVNGIARAEKDGAALVVISLDTPGGLDPSMRKVIQKILASRIPVAVYVAPPGGRAASAGTFITLAAHVAAMAPNTSIGAAHPVTLGAGGEGGQDETMAAKVTNDAVSYIQGLARLRGRNAAWAELAVRKSASLAAEDAVTERVVDFVAPDLAGVIARADGRRVKVAGRDAVIRTRGARVEEETPNWRARVLAVLTDPNVAYILLVLGFYGLLFELSNPGSILPGIAGGICIILAFYALSTLPVNYAGVALIVFALILFIAEVKVTSHGLLTVGGVISMLLGSLLLIDTPAPYLRISWWVIVPAVVITALFFLFAVGLGLQAQRRRATTGDQGMMGQRGVTVTAVNAAGGRVFVGGEYWRATAEREIPAGTTVEVARATGLELRVRRADH
jgi:membrane-bound serine protease (ClpP class)